MHSLLVSHYLNGAWYPKGGASEIAYHMIPIIEKAGGAVLVRAPVNRILFNDSNEAYGGFDGALFPLLCTVAVCRDEMTRCACSHAFRC